MKIVRVITTLAFSGLFAILPGCKKENDKGLNRISVEGNANSVYNNEYNAEEASYILPRVWDCTTTMYRSDIWIFCTPESVLWMGFYLPQSDGLLPAGTFSLAEACSEGFMASFYNAPPRKAVGIWFSSGNVTVNRNGETYNIDFSLTIDEDCGGGTLSGNFCGTMEPEELK